MSSDIEVPKWLDEKFIEQALRKYEDSEIKVRKINVRPATSTGDNYCSIMFRVTAHFYKCNELGVGVYTKSVIVKAFPETEHMRKLVTQNDAFITETEVLRRLIPAFHHLLNASTSEGQVSLAAKCYYYTDLPEHKLVLEDLCESGFVMPQKNKGLDLDHCKMAISRLAMFHAASFAMRRQDSQSFDQFLNNPLLKGEVTLSNVLQNSLSNVANRLNEWPELAEKYSDRLRRLGGVALHRMEEAVLREEEGFNVLNHGDFWTNNMMFKYDDEGKLSDIRFVDFQYCYYGSPVLDLQYFLYTSPSSDVRKLHSDHLLECYHTSLSLTLDGLGFGNHCPSLVHLRTEMDKRSFFGIFAATVILPITFVTPGCAADFGAMYDNTLKIESGQHFTEEFMKEIINLLPIFERKDLLD